MLTSAGVTGYIFCTEQSLCKVVPSWEEMSVFTGVSLKTGDPIKVDFHVLSAKRNFRGSIKTPRSNEGRVSIERRRSNEREREGGT